MSRLGTINALVLSGLANFRVVGDSEANSDAKGVVGEREGGAGTLDAG